MRYNDTPNNFLHLEDHNDLEENIRDKIGLNATCSCKKRLEKAQTFLGDLFNVTDVINETDCSENSSCHYDGWCSESYIDNLQKIYDRRRDEIRGELELLSAVLGIIAVVGFCGNVTVLYLYGRSKVRQIHLMFVLSLAVVDLMSCVCIIPSTLVAEWLYMFPTDIHCKLMHLGRSALLPISALLLISIAVERFFTICHPIERPYRNWEIWGIIILVFIFGFLIAIPYTLTAGTYAPTDDPDELIYIGICRTVNVLISADAIDIYWFCMTVIYVMMAALIYALYISIFIFVYKANSRLGKIMPNQTTTTTKLSNVTPSTSKDTDQDSISSSLPKPLNENYNTGDLNKPPNAQKQVSIPLTAMNSQAPLVASQKSNGLLMCFKMKTKGPTNKNQPVKINVKPMAESTWNPHKWRQHLNLVLMMSLISSHFILVHIPVFLHVNGVPMQRTVFFIYFLNNAINPIIYVILNKRFREAMLQAFHCIHCTCTCVVRKTWD